MQVGSKAEPRDVPNEGLRNARRYVNFRICREDKDDPARAGNSRPCGGRARLRAYCRRRQGRVIGEGYDDWPALAPSTLARKK